ncbi:acyltransferase family protein [Mycolicibacterium fluoranthenivorans]|uniref:Acyltransferase family protein n=1 Tax=Mycolicibacterium fluoranthenivorans TaxID=258505 RepID=A0A7G8PE96_9MYCO|nr:lysophospholipid acyltransferase family protein [Mycolicibacterium fluoranthenivorans]QNJ92662.1 acyltransferase family protein [Mycolicibacterium fluoranthenivorans]
MKNAAARTEQIIEQPARVRALRKLVEATADGLWPAIELSRPYIDGTENLPRDGRFFLVGNHTQTGMGEAWLTCLAVRRAIGTRVRPLTERGMGSMPGPMGDVLAACGGVVGTPENATKLMQNNETLLVFPGGGREIGKFKGEEYQLKWQGRAGFARVAIANDYPIVPFGYVGGDDIYHSITPRDSLLGRLTEKLGLAVTGKPDMTTPLVRGIGPTLIPSPQRNYLRFGQPIDTTQPAGVSDDEWVETVKKTTQTAVENILRELQDIRAEDPFRQLNPLAWRDAVQPQSAVS